MNTIHFWSGFKDELQKLGGFPTLDVKTRKDNVISKTKLTTSSRQHDISDNVVVKKPKVP